MKSLKIFNDKIVSKNIICKIYGGQSSDATDTTATTTTTTSNTTSTSTTTSASATTSDTKVVNVGNTIVDDLNGLITINLLTRVS